MTKIDRLKAELENYHVVFQAIADIEQRSIMGYECFMRSDSDDSGSVSALLTTYDLDMRELMEIDRYLIQREVSVLCHVSSQYKLFINVIPLYSHDLIRENINFLLESCADATTKLVIEISDCLPNLTSEQIILATQSYRQAGFKVSLDLAGSDPRNIRLWSDLKPDFLKVDRFSFQFATEETTTAKLLENMISVAVDSNIVMIAEGVESLDELSFLFDRGIHFAQGVYVSASQAMPVTHLANVVQWPQDHHVHKDHKEQKVAVDLCIPALSVESSRRLDEVVNIFLEDKNRLAMAVTHLGQVLGIAERQKIMDVFASRFGRSLHAQKSIDNFLSEAVIVEANTPLTYVSKLLTNQRQAELQAVFVITGADGLYLGVGKVVDLLKAITDQSYSKELGRLLHVIQDQSRARQQELEVMVKTRTSELEQAMMQLEMAQEELVQSEKMASLGQLVAGVAHEVNTPLGLAYTLITHLSEKRDLIDGKLRSGSLTKQDFQIFLDSAKETLEVGESNLRKAANLIQSFKQVAVDQSYDEKRQLSIYSLCQEIAVSTRHVLKKDNHELLLDVPETLIVDTYPGAISQILTNLIMNANIHAFDGQTGGNIRIVARPNPRGAVCIEVSDDGKGISDEYVKKIFDPFFTTKRGSGGSGLGLHIVFNLVSHKLGGKIDCHSVVGQGTTFKICF